MIGYNSGVFKLDTDESSYLFRILPTGHLEQLYYGAYIDNNDDYSALYEKTEIEYGNSVAYLQEDTSFCLEQVCLEYSGVGRGDFREAAIDINGSFTTDYRYCSHRIYAGKAEIPGLPSSYGACDTLEIVLADEQTDSLLTLFYHVFAWCNVIPRHTTVTAGETPLTITRIMSAMIDFPRGDFTLSSLGGSWADEMNLREVRLTGGTHLNDSKAGVSSSRHNPFLMLTDDATTEDDGDCYGFQLVYSGNHCEIAEVSPQNRTRVLLGINPFHFAAELGCGESFATPEAVLTYSSCGKSGMSRNLHRFVREHIVRGEWKSKARPVLVNSWEGNYFDFDEKKLICQAAAAKKLGAELFVVDDGWFGRRNNDKTSLGDWFANTEKLPHGLAGLSKAFHSLGIGLGLWIEPEMVSVDSELYRQHSDWAVAVPNRHLTMGRNQLVLDLTREEVRDYLVATISQVISSADISYIKWDMNRNIADAYSAQTQHNHCFYHRYTLGLYDILNRTTSAFPHILFEGCAAGGNRFDLGMLCYLPQIWLSDNTDAARRAQMQYHASLAYPPSVICAHVSSCPNHQTGRTLPLNTRFSIACSGVLGYELDVCSLTEQEEKTVTAQIDFYKKRRELFQYGDFYRLAPPKSEASLGWVIVSQDEKSAVAVLSFQAYYCNRRNLNFKLKGLNPQWTYVFSDYPTGMQQHQGTGSLFCNAGVRLNRRVPCDGLGNNGLVAGDFGSVLFDVSAK